MFISKLCWFYERFFPRSDISVNTNSAIIYVGVMKAPNDFLKLSYLLSHRVTGVKEH